LLGITFVEQNKHKSSHYAKMANEGQQITWFIHAGHWGSIIDGKIETQTQKQLFKKKF
jgi:hypothetical protein